MVEYSTQIIEEVLCPFCKEGIIRAHHIPKMLVTRSARGSAKRKTMKYFKDEKWQILSPECPHCHKSKNKIEERFRCGSNVTASDAAKKAIAAGLPTKI